MAEYANNPKAGFDYEILETLEAGIVLKGYEVKSIKTGKVSIKENTQWGTFFDWRHHFTLSGRQYSCRL